MDINPVQDDEKLDHVRSLKTFDNIKSVNRSVELNRPSPKTSMGVTPFNGYKDESDTGTVYKSIQKFQNYKDNYHNDLIE